MSLNPALAPLEMNFVTVKGTRLRYSRIGQGPAVVLLPASPCSIKVFERVQRAWANDFTAIAIDLPGFGLSQTLPGDRMETTDIADLMVEAVAALGYEKAAYYGRHTGAGVAVEIANRHPERVSMSLADGFPVFANPYSPERLEEYLTEITPRWDGSHLTYCWFRYREQHVFWPYDRPLEAHRADMDMHPLPFLYRGAVELAGVIDTYRKTYASAFRHPGLKMIHEVKATVCYGNRPGDSQFKTIGTYPKDVWVKEFPREWGAAAAEELKVLKEHPAPLYEVPALAPALDAQFYLPTRHGFAYGRAFGLGTSGKPLLYLHDIPGATDIHTPEMEVLAKDRPVFGIDLGGNGYSDLAEGASPSLGLWKEQIEDLLAIAGFDAIDIYAHGTSAEFALLLEESLGGVGEITFRSPPRMAFSPEFVARYAPDITPSWEGANFLRLWHHLRDQQLWFPWFDQRRENARKSFDILPEHLHVRAILLAQQPEHYQTLWKIALSGKIDECFATPKDNYHFAYAPTDLFGFLANAAPQDGAL